MQIPVDIPIIIVPLFGITALWFMSTWGVAFAGFGALRTGKICHHCRSKIHLKAKICPSCDLPQADKDLTTELRPHPEGLVSAGVRTARSERRAPPSATRQKTSRKADGQPKFRSVDEMLAQAFTGEAFASLPGKGNPSETSPEPINQIASRRRTAASPTVPTPRPVPPHATPTLRRKLPNAGHTSTFSASAHRENQTPRCNDRRQRSPS